jgi:hypothetical protein
MPYLGVILFFSIVLCPLFPPLLLGAVEVVERIRKSDS